MVFGLTSNPNRLIQLIRRVHDNQDVYITILMRFTIGKGTKENNLIGIELLGNLSGEPADNRHRGTSGGKPPGRWQSGNTLAGCAHAAIIPTDLAYRLRRQS